MAYSLLRHLTYNEWANQKIADVLLTTPDEIFFNKTGSSFSSIGDTVKHMWGAQYIWLMRLMGTSLREWPTNKFEGIKERLLEGFVQSGTDLVVFLSTFNETRLSDTYNYTNMKGDPFEDTYADTLFHIVNHSTYHRGQIITMLRQSGADRVVSTDLIHYLRLQKK
jgi:uncharacterized damage-inducible protein DinB